MRITIGKNTVQIKENDVLDANTYLINKDSLELHPNAYKIVQKLPPLKRLEFIVKLKAKQLDVENLANLHSLASKNVFSDLTIHPPDSPPLLPQEGDSYYSTVDQEFHVYTGNSWSIMGS
jgi:hypothetical protein